MATAIAEGVERGDVDVRLSRIAMPGIHDAGQAMRMAIQRLNRAELIDLATTMTAPARAAPLRAGDVIRVTHPCGLAEKAFRIQAVAGQMGDYKLSLIEYDAVAYSNAVVTHSTTPDTDLPDPAAPPAPIGLAVTEEVYELRDGSCSSRLRIVWDAAQWLYLDRYYVEVSEGGQVINTQAPLTAEARTPAVQEQDLSSRCQRWPGAARSPPPPCKSLPPRATACRPARCRRAVSSATRPAELLT